MSKKLLNFSNRRGFSLIEITIALIILGLLISGITVGSTLLDQAGNRAVITELDGYNNSIMAFRLAYGGIPGDYDKPKDISLHNGTTCAIEANGGGELKGDGNGQIGVLTANGVSVVSGDASKSDEASLVFCHLYLAKMGSLITFPSFSDTVNRDLPTSKTNRGSFLIYYGSSTYKTGTTASVSGTDEYGFKTDNAIVMFNQVAKNHNVLANDALTGALTPSQANYIITKTDNGEPDSGEVRIGNSGNLPPSGTTCVNKSTLNTSVKSKACVLYRRIASF